MASTTSPAMTMPRSPWLASAGCTNNAGVPVDASVAAILRPTWPLLPMPITTTRPRHSSIACTALREAVALARRQRLQRARLDLEGLARPAASARCGVEGAAGFTRVTLDRIGILGVPDGTPARTRIMATTLELALLYLVAAVLGVVACRSLKLPPMLGYLVVGVVIGPNALALAKDSAGVKYLAEFGVVFLMFVIGLEFNLPKLRSMRTLVFGLGLSQVVLTMRRHAARPCAAGLELLRITGHAWQMALAGRGGAGRRDGHVAAPPSSSS